MNERISVLRRIILFFISFAMGLLLAEMTLYLLIPIFPISIQNKMTLGLGALVSSTINLKLLLWLIKNLMIQLNYSIFSGVKIMITSTLNAICCLMIAVRLFTFFNLSHRAYLAQIVMNLTLLLCLLKSKGNIGTLCRKPKSRKKS